MRRVSEHRVQWRETEPRHKRPAHPGEIRAGALGEVVPYPSASIDFHPQHLRHRTRWRAPETVVRECRHSGQSTANSRGTHDRRVGIRHCVHAVPRSCDVTVRNGTRECPADCGISRKLTGCGDASSRAKNSDEVWSLGDDAGHEPRRCPTVGAVGLAARNLC